VPESGNKGAKEKLEQNEKGHARRHPESRCCFVQVEVEGLTSKTESLKGDNAHMMTVCLLLGARTNIHIMLGDVRRHRWRRHV